MAVNNAEATHSGFWANLFKSPTEKADLEKSLLAIPPFKSLGKRDLEILSNLIHNRSYIAGEYIFSQGDPGIGLYIIREGEVTVQRTDDNTILSLATFKKGDFFGELALVDGEKRSASAIANSDVRLAVIFKPDLDEYIEKYPKKGIKILQGITHIITIRLRHLNEQYYTLQKKSQEIKSGSENGT
jgi:CRP/FNR family cyclic AMP-dependent transcriptional regulator